MSGVRYRGAQISKSAREAIYAAHDYRCALCGAKPPKDKLTLDHIVPRSKGGTNDAENLQPACPRCNRRKGNRDEAARWAAIKADPEKLSRERAKNRRASAAYHERNREAINSHNRETARQRGPRLRDVTARLWSETKADCAAYKRAMRLDPCAYCGTRDGVGIDHVVPVSNGGGRTDVLNMTGCCKRCNETKHRLPLLLALPWIPLSRSYHDARRFLFVPKGWGGAESTSPSFTDRKSVV